MSQSLYSVEQAAALLGLHVKTVRAYLRDGRLKGRRIGKQYRIMHQDLESLAGGSLKAQSPRHVEVSTVILIDDTDQNKAYRLTTALNAAVNGKQQDDGPVRIDTVFDVQRARLKIMISAGITTAAHLMGMVKLIAGD